MASYTIESCALKLTGELMPLGRARLMESSLSESSTAWLWWKMASVSESMCRVSGPAMVSMAAMASSVPMESPAVES